MAQAVKNPPVMQEALAQSLGWEDPLEEGMATHSSILAWRIPTDRGTWWAAVHGGCKESDTTGRLSIVERKEKKKNNTQSKIKYVTSKVV